MNIIVAIIAIVAALVLGGVCGFLIFRFVIKGKYNEMVSAANKEAEVIKEKKLLEVKEKFLNKKSELEKEVQQRNQHIQQSENKLKQREISLNQRQEELGRRKNDLDNQQNRIDNEKKVLALKQEELDKMQMQERAKLEELSGLSAEEAKARLVESLKDEAKTQAQAYINEIVDEAKLNANAQAKKIVIQTIQRVATETAVENSVSVFHIDNDDVKGRVIGREGRNIRALEAACGVEIVVDDTPEAIVISAFDPVRRETCRLALHQLVADGRIHPARIEEVVAKVKKQLENEIIETGKRTAIDLGIHGLHPELIRIISTSASPRLMSATAFSAARSGRWSSMRMTSAKWVSSTFRRVSFVASSVGLTATRRNDCLASDTCRSISWKVWTIFIVIRFLCDKDS